ncbi:MAG: NUMOD3 domain-containing DNA-binding protein [Nitrososphaeraceae archaeon]
MTYPKGEHLTEEHRKKISLAHKGKPKPWLHGRKHTPKARACMSREVKKAYQESRPPCNKGIKYPQERLEQMLKS